MSGQGCRSLPTKVTRMTWPVTHRKLWVAAVVWSPQLPSRSGTEESAMLLHTALQQHQGGEMPRGEKRKRRRNVGSLLGLATLSLVALVVPASPAAADAASAMRNCQDGRVPQTATVLGNRGRKSRGAIPCKPPNLAAATSGAAVFLCDFCSTSMIPAPATTVDIGDSGC